MPELPEVETIRRDLSELVIGKRFAKIEVRAAKMVQPRDLSKKILGLKIKKIFRRAKLLIFELSSGQKLLIHLKMTGQLIYRDSIGVIKAVGGHPIKHDLQTLPNKFSRVVFIFSDRSYLFFNDVRKFGYLKLVDSTFFEKVCQEYGVEPLSEDFSLKNFEKILVRRPKMKIKQLLMEQGLIAGLGNIYADEVCFQAGVRPMRKAGELSLMEIKKIWQAIPVILKKSIDKRGTSADTYVDAWGRAGGFKPYLMVYGRDGEKCKKCGTKILKIRLGGRGTHYCPRCQR